MSVLIGHASIDENRQAHGGQAGDQTGREVYILGWYAAAWNVLLRPKSQAVAEKMAAACEILCKGNLVGYDQWNRNDLWDQLEKVGWDASKLKVKTETDCSAFITALARIAGVSIPRVSLGNGKYNAPVTQTMRSAFGSTGAWTVLTDSKYLTGDQYLKRGDILIRESGHTALVLSNGALCGAAVATTAVGQSAAVPPTTLKIVKATEYAQLRDSELSGVYETNTTVNVRNGAGAAKKTLVTVPKGTRCRCYGFYSRSYNANWPYVALTHGGTTYEGFVCAAYLQKV